MREQARAGGRDLPVELRHLRRIGDRRRSSRRYPGSMPVSLEMRRPGHFAARQKIDQQPVGPSDARVHGGSREAARTQVRPILLPGVSMSRAARERRRPPPRFDAEEVARPARARGRGRRPARSGPVARRRGAARPAPRPAAPRRGSGRGGGRRERARARGATRRAARLDAREDARPFRDRDAPGAGRTRAWTSRRRAARNIRRRPVSPS